MKSKLSKLNIYKDNRGYNMNISTFDAKQILISKNEKNVLRGIHVSPYYKYITLLSGKIEDYIINYENYTYEKYVLTSDENNQLYIPPNYGHIFITLEESIIMYQFGGYYDLEIDKVH